MDKTKKNKQKYNTICVEHQYMQTNTNNLNKTWALLQTTGDKDEANIVNKIWAILQTTGGKDDPNIT